MRDGIIWDIKKNLLDSFVNKESSVSRGGGDRNLLFALYGGGSEYQTINMT